MLSFRLNAKLFLLLLLEISVIGAHAQTAAQSKEIEHIKNGSEYYWGEGVGKTAESADKAALSMLIGGISVHVTSIFEEGTTQVETNDGIDFRDSVKIRVTTYSNATLNNTEKRSWGKEPNVHVFRFIKQTEVEKIFADREWKVKELVREARKAEANFQIADALRDYYWAQMLLRSLPKPGNVTMEIDGERQRLEMLLPRQIKSVFRSLTFSVSEKEQGENLTKYLLYITYNNQPVVNCEYSFSDGRNWSLPVAAKDGYGTSDMAGRASMHEALEIKIEYVFENEWKIDKDVNDVMQSLEPVPFPESYISVPLGGKSVKAKKPAALTVKQADGKPYMDLLKRVEKAIRNKDYTSVRDCFTDEGYDIFERLIKYGNAVIITNPVYAFMEFEDGVIARSLPMRFSFNNNRRVFVEDVVFDVEASERKIRSLSFGLPGNVCRDILKHDQWSEYARLAIIQFIENYKTAYALKRLDYIKSIFSDDALIIVGKVLKKHTVENTLITPEVKLTRYSKDQYMTQLDRVFRSQEYVNLKFTDIDVKVSQKLDDVYGIQLKQDYFSSGYGDSGYLFLVVDLRTTNEPVIHVRTWQPEKDPDFGTYDLPYFKL
jgi:hypothetical protein